MPCEYLNCILCLLLQSPCYRSECNHTPFFACFNNSSLLNLEGGEADIVRESVVQNCSGQDNKVWPLTLQEKCPTVRVSLVFWTALQLSHWVNLYFSYHYFRWFKYINFDHANTFVNSKKNTQLSSQPSHLSTGKDTFQAIKITLYSVPMTLPFRPY